MKIPDITRIIAEIQEFDSELGSIKVEGESGGGMVKAVVSGKQELLRLEIDRSLIDGKDKELIEDLVVAAVNNAIKKSLETIAERMKAKALKFGVFGGGSKGADDERIS